MHQNVGMRITLKKKKNHNQNQTKNNLNNTNLPDDLHLNSLLQLSGIRSGMLFPAKTLFVYGLWPYRLFYVVV